MGAGHTTLSSAYVEEDATEPLHEDYVVDQRLFPGSGRMMRTFRLSHRQTGSSVVAKTMWVQHPHEEQVVKAQEAELQRIKEALKGSPHIATFWLWRIGNIKQEIRPVVLVRNHVYTTLADRLESRPFLTHVEKLWIIYQLLHAIQCMHDAGVVHGFLTTENIGLTSWNYLVILDIASYKARTALPDDDPSEYRYYFQEYHKHGTDTTQREKRCYLAPERFYSPKVDGVPTASALTTESMDVFSAGCILLETSLNGERAMDLGHLMDYRKNKSFPPQVQQKFQKIESSSLRAACRHMMHLDATQRLSPNEYLERLQEIMPCTFSETFEPLIERITNTVKTPDARIALAAASYSDILKATVGVNDIDGKIYFANILGPSFCQAEHLEYARQEQETIKVVDEAIDHAKLIAETEALLKRLQIKDWGNEGMPEDEKKTTSKNEEKDEAVKAPAPDSLLIYVQLILVSMRHVYRPSSKLVALELLRRLAAHSSDETRLQRIIPSTISLLQDQDPLVRALALQVLTNTLSIIQSFPPSDSKIFPQYIFKRVAHLITDPSLVVRVTFSSCISVLAETSRRFLDISHAVRLYEAVGGGSGSATPDPSTKIKDGEVFDEDVAMLLDGPQKGGDLEQDGAKRTNQTLQSIHNTLIANTYDSELSALHEVVSRFVVHISTDPSEQSSSPKRALLRDLARLCNFFGGDGVMTFILPQVLAFLNDRRDWQLRAALFRDLPSLCYIIGRAATEHFVLPCLETALVDSEDQVLAAALTCLASLVDLSLLSRSVLVDTHREGPKESNKFEALFKKYIPLLLYPADDVRHSAIVFVNSCCKALGSPDTEVFLVPTLRPYIRFEPSEYHLTTVQGLNKCLVARLTRKQMEDQLSHLTLEARVTSSGEIKASDGSQKKPVPLGSSVDGETNTQVLEYLKMLCRSRSNKSEPAPEVSTKLAAAIEGSLKLSQNIKFPTQTVAATLENSIPNWFTSARETAKDTNSGSEFSALQSVPALNQVFGLSIMRGAEDTPGAFEHAAATGEDYQIEDKELHDMMMNEKAKQVDSAIAGEWGSECVLDPSLNMTTSLVGKLKGLEVPTLSPRLGVSLESNSTRESLSKGMGDWRPKMECLAATSSPLGGHSGPVSRLAVSFDQRFFVSASFDSTCKVWELGKIDNSPGIMESSLTYSGHNDDESSTRVRINDIALLESSHSVASASSDGRVHVWRVDMVPTNNHSPGFGNYSDDNARVSGSTVVKTIDSAVEGEILAVSHYNSLSRSVLAFATQRGSVHSWDLRSEKEPFQLKHEAQLGYLTSMALGTDRNWMVTGSSKGFVALWDIRWPSMVKLWHHSGSKPITRLAASYATIPSGKPNVGPRPLMFISSGNECGMFDIIDGTCRQGFRVLTSDGYCGLSTSTLESMSLTEINCASGRNLGRQIRQCDVSKVGESRATVNGPQVNAMVGSMGGYDQNYLITGGSDAYIRYWDFTTPSKCYTVSGQVVSHGRPAYERVDFQGSNRLMVCRQNTGLRPQDFESSKAPRKLQRGHARAESRHRDAILDLKLIRNPIKAIISSSRDGTIKLFK